MGSGSRGVPFQDLGFRMSGSRIVQDLQPLWLLGNFLRTRRVSETPGCDKCPSTLIHFGWDYQSGTLLPWGLRRFRG